MTEENPSETHEVVESEPGALPPQAAVSPFLITASELRDRKTKRREGLRAKGSK